MAKHKIVINTCFGGFSLSDEAVKWLETNAKDKKLREFLAKERQKASKMSENERWGATIEEIMESGLKYDFRLPRHHKDLVKVVETLKDKASGGCAQLCIAKINGDLYRIDGYDGAESVIEPDDYKWVHIND